MGKFVEHELGCKTGTEPISEPVRYLDRSCRQPNRTFWTPTTPSASSGRRKGTEQLRGADGGRALCNCKHHQPRPQQGRWQVTVPVAVARHRMIRRVTSGPGSFLVLTMRTAFGGLCLRRRNRLRSSTGRIPTATWTSKVDQRSPLSWPYTLRQSVWD